MAVNIISAVRRCDKLHGNLKFTALEVAHRLNAQGYGPVAYRYLAAKTGYCRRTAINHMHRLVALGIFRKTVYRLKFGHAINTYQCLLPVPQLSRTRPPGVQSASAARTLPPPKTEEKSLALEEEIRRQRWSLHNLPLSTEARQACLDKLAALEALRRPVCP